MPALPGVRIVGSALAVLKMLMKYSEKSRRFCHAVDLWPTHVHIRAWISTYHTSWTNGIISLDRSWSADSKPGMARRSCSFAWIWVCRSEERRVGKEGRSRRVRDL